MTECVDRGHSASARPPAHPPGNGPRICLVDIETAPIEANVWGLWDQNVGLNQIISEWVIISYTAKQLGAKNSSLVYSDTQGAPREDYNLCAELWHILNDNDFIIAQNGKKFDIKKIRARLIMHGFAPPSPCTVIDTMLIAREVAAFTSNKLEWLSQYLSSVKKSKHKDFPGFELWQECMLDNPRAWAAMKTYNKVDVLSMEHVYTSLRPYALTHPNLAAFYDDKHNRCPVCGSTKVSEDGLYKGVYRRFNCGSCGAWSRSRASKHSKVQPHLLLAK